MAVYDIKISGAQNEKIAKMMGDDVTPKAITHRLSKIKAQAASFSHTNPGTPASARKRPSIPASTSTKTPGSKTAKAGKILGQNGKMLSATHTITTLMQDDGEDDEEEFDTPTRVKTEPGSSKKRKIAAPKIEDFVGYAEDDGEDDNGDAIDFSLAYPDNAAIVKVEEDTKMDGANDNGNNKAKSKGKGKERAEIVDLTETADTIDINELCHQANGNGTPRGKGKAKEQEQTEGSATNAKVKEEVVDFESMFEDEDGEMVV